MASVLSRENLVSVMMALSLSVLSAGARAEGCVAPVVFFDFGETIIHAEYVKQFDVFVNNRYTPGTFQYLTNLRNLGYTLGMLVNYPESYGGGLPTIEERDQRKIDFIKRETSEPLPPELLARPDFKSFCIQKFGSKDAPRLCQTWTDPLYPMVWSFFNLPEFGDLPGVEGRGILVPDKDTQRKPAPYLFQRALSVARRVQQLAIGGNRNAPPACPVVYMGEDPKEIQAANKVGMIGIRVGFKSWPDASGKWSFLYPEHLLRALREGDKPQAPTGPQLP